MQHVGSSEQLGRSAQTGIQGQPHSGEWAKPKCWMQSIPDSFLHESDSPVKVVIQEYIHLTMGVTGGLLVVEYVTN